MNYLEENKETYNALAEEYEDKASVRKNYNEKVISKSTKYLKENGKVLDLGCAVGLESSIFESKGFNVVGLDISEEMIKKALKRNPNAKIIQGDFLDTSFEENFDGIFAQAFIHLFPKEDALEVMEKIKDILKEDGYAYITTSKEEESKEGLYEKEDYEGDKKRYRKHWSYKELNNTLKKVGFNIEEYFSIEDPYEKTWMVFIVSK